MSWSTPASSVLSTYGTVSLNANGAYTFTLKPNDFHAALCNSSRCLKAILLDQSIVAGVGNIYADESLHRAKLLPTRTGLQE